MVCPGQAVLLATRSAWPSLSRTGRREVSLYGRPQPGDDLLPDQRDRRREPQDVPRQRQPQPQQLGRRERRPGRSLLGVGAHLTGYRVPDVALERGRLYEALRGGRFVLITPKTSASYEEQGTARKDRLTVEHWASDCPHVKTAAGGARHSPGAP
ncbi:hypothetical protein M2271_001231 [Streptomyces sp. LBL]|nr:hypothetical protein [Streptomyces sp. LBL]